MLSNLLLPLTAAFCLGAGAVYLLWLLSVLGH
jgi:hypothetical protein